MNYVRTNFGREVLADRDDTIIAIKYPKIGWQRVYSLDETLRLSGLTPLGQITTTVGVAIQVRDGKRNVAAFQKTELADNFPRGNPYKLTSIDDTIIFSEEIGMPYQNVFDMMGGHLDCTKNYEALEKSIATYGIKKVIDTLSEPSTLLAIAYLQFKGKKDLANEALEHYERIVFSQRFISNPKEHLKEFRTKLSDQIRSLKTIDISPSDFQT